jgi:hypothetical protein
MPTSTVVLSPHTVVTSLVALARHLGALSVDFVHVLAIQGSFGELLATSLRRRGAWRGRICTAHFRVSRPRPPPTHITVAVGFRYWSTELLDIVSPSLWLNYTVS